MFGKATAKVKGNLVGTAIGAVATYWAIGKYTGISKTWVKIALTVAGGVAGAYAQSALAAKKSTPKSSTIK